MTSENPERGLAGAQVLVTGASGFIGSRIVERLVAAGAHVRAFVHNYANAVGIARYPIDLVGGDVLDACSLAEACTGCQFVFHCAYTYKGSPTHQHRVIAGGTENVVQAALQEGVARLVHISTIAVHGLDPGELTVDEAAPFCREHNDLYGRAKIEAEEVIWRYHRSNGLPATVLRPAIVYGPRSQWWTVEPIERMKEGVFWLIDGGQGICNPIYIDDVVEAAVLAALRPAACGHAFILSSTPVTWNDFYSYHSRMLRLDDLPNWSQSELRTARKRQRVLESSFGRMAAYLGSPKLQILADEVPFLATGLSWSAKLMPRHPRAVLRREISALYEQKNAEALIPGEAVTTRHRSRTVYSADKAHRLLGFIPGVSLAEGMRRTEQWLVHTGLL